MQCPLCKSQNTTHFSMRHGVESLVCDACHADICVETIPADQFDEEYVGTFNQYLDHERGRISRRGRN